MAEFLNASPAEIAFGLNMTTLTFHLARALGRRLGPGDAIIVTELDHHANIDPWRALERERGVAILQVRMVPETGELDWNDLDRCLTDHRVKLLAIGAASNALGTINDVARAVAMAREADALSFVDAVHYAPHQLVDVREWGCDFLACSAYKFHGPHVGVLYGKRERLEALDVPKLQPAPETVPEKLETGTQNHEGIVGTAAAVDYLASLATADGRQLHPARGASDYRPCSRHSTNAEWRSWTALGWLERDRRRQDLWAAAQCAADADPCLHARRRPAEEVCRLLAAGGIFASHGNFYAMTVVERLGVADHGLVRLGCACYTTDEEVARVIEGGSGISRGSIP